MINIDLLTDNDKKYVKFMLQEGLANSTIENYCSVIRSLRLIESRLYRLTNEQIQDFILDSISTVANVVNFS